MVKAYTDLDQSKKLAEILPIESADMHYNVVGDAIIGDYQSGISSARSVAKAYKKNPDEFAKNVIPCWSLAALLDFLSANFYTDIKYLDNQWELDCRVQVTYARELVDACYEMILKLHEQKLL